MPPMLRRMLRGWPGRLFSPRKRLEASYRAFKALLEADEKSLLLVAELEEILHGLRPADPARTVWLCTRLDMAVRATADRLTKISPSWDRDLDAACDRIETKVRRCLHRPEPETAPPYLLTLDQALGRPDLAGGKAVGLARAARQALQNVPAALVVSTRAFNRFLAQAGLRPRLDRLLARVDLSRTERLALLCAKMRALIMKAELPEEIVAALQAARNDSHLCGKRLAVRSSAVAEDGDRSFAGQYASELDVRPEDLEQAFRRVLAAKYRPRAVAYRILNGLPDTATPMAVLIMPMIQARVSGVLFSTDQTRGVSVFALAGPGARLMDGQASPRHLCLSRGIPPVILGDSGPKSMVMDQGLLTELTESALALEKGFGAAQEVEWVQDCQGRVFILQSRPHNPAPPLPVQASSVPLGQSPATVLAAGCLAVSPGAGCGPVFRISDPAHAVDVPAGAVLVVEHLSPGLCKWVDRVAAVIADCGSPASHFASVAREFGLPVVCGARAAFDRLAQDRVVTVDARAGRILDGRVEAVLGSADLDRRHSVRAAVHHFPGLFELTCHLGLTDPEAEAFTPVGCASWHDLVRFCHEKAVLGMFSVAEKAGPNSRAARKLDTGLPLSLYVLDLGGGLLASALDRPVLTPEDLDCAPFTALLQGLSSPGEEWTRGGLHCDWEAFDRISAGIFRLDTPLLASHALVSPDYLHLQVRFGYHFAVLNTLCGRRSEANFITFRFKGGGGVYEQRLLRVSFLVQVLERFGFTVRARGDLLDARQARAGQTGTADRLGMLGRLLTRTRLMDLSLTSADQARDLAEAFAAQCRTQTPEGRP